MQIHNRFLVFLAPLLCFTAMTLSACGVKGPPEPPLPSEASLKKTEVAPVEASETKSPVIFPIKKDAKKKDGPKKQGP